MNEEATDPAATEEAAPIEATPPLDETAPAEDTDLPAAPAPPVPVPTARRIRSASALIVAAVLVAVGVFLTLGGVDALVGHGPGSSPGQPRPSASVPTNASRFGLV